MNRILFQTEKFNVAESIETIENVQDYEMELSTVLDQIQKDIVSVLDMNYTTLQALQSRIQNVLYTSNIYMYTFKHNKMRYASYSSQTK